MRLLELFAPSRRRLWPRRLRAGGPALSAAPMRRANAVRSIVAASVLLIGALAGGAWMLLWDLRNDQIAKSERDLESLAIVLSEQIDRSFQSIDLVLTGVLEGIKGLDLVSGEKLADRMSDYAIHLSLREQMRPLPYIDALVITDADGKLVTFSRTWPIPDIRINQTPAHVFKEHPELTSVVGKPLRNPVDGEWVISLARKVTDAQGEFVGVVLGVMKLKYFEDYFHRVARNQSHSVSLFDADARLLARYPVDENLRGRSFAHRRIFKDVLSTESYGTVREEGITARGDLLISGRKVPHYPLAVIVTQTLADSLASWRYAALYGAGGTLIIALMIAGLSFYVATRVGRDLKAQNHRLDAALNNMPQGLAMFDAAGRLIVCNEHYLQMYDLPAELMKPGCSFNSILRWRIDNGTFVANATAADADKYIGEVMASIAVGKPTSTVRELIDGRVIAVRNQPMSGGGWVGTHDDITDARRREASFRLLFESNPVPMWVYDVDTMRFIAVNDAAVAQYGYSREQFMSMSMFAIRPAEEHERLLQAVKDREGHGGKIWTHLRANGQEIKVMVYARGLDYDGHRARLVAAHDITDRQRAEEQLRRTQKFLDTIIEHVPAAILVKDAPSESAAGAGEWRYSLLNRAAENLLGVTRAQVVGKTVHEVYTPEEAKRIVEENNAALASAQALAWNDHAVRTVANGVRLITAKNVAVRDDNDKPRYLLTVIEDVTDRKRAEQHVARMAHYDGLTDLPNRTSFNDALSATIERAEQRGEQFAVLAVDLDGFKEANDTYGHSTGDALLREVARLLAAASQGAFVARLGGDEFALLVTEGEQPAAAEAAIARLQNALADDVIVDDRRIKVGATMGGAIYPASGADAKTLMINADIALYRAKADMRGGVLFFDAAMGEKVHERRAVETALHSAVARNELFLHYQPQKKMSGETTGFEALLRWRCPQRGLISPGVFIPIAEESGVIAEIGEWVLREACREAASWPEPLSVAVNVSPVQFRTGDLPALVHSILLETGLSPSRLELEVTEGVLIEDFSRALAILFLLKSYGVRIALDDFGSGYSSLSYLHAVSFDKIKIDRGFVGDLEKSRRSQAIVGAVIDMGHRLQIPILAEGVETVAQHSLLKRGGCDEVQGYLTGRPLPIEDYAELVGRAAPPDVQEMLAG